MSENPELPTPVPEEPKPAVPEKGCCSGCLPVIAVIVGVMVGLSIFFGGGDACSRASDERSAAARTTGAESARHIQRAIEEQAACSRGD